MKEVFNYLDARIFSYYHEANKILREIMPLPRMFTFMPSAICNHSCPGCDWSNENKARYIIPTEQWKKIFNELYQQNSIRFIEFAGLGEPMLHQDIREMILTAGAYGWIIGIITNGTRLKEPVLKDLIKRAAFIRVSMESGSEKVFNKIKIPQSEEDGFFSVCRNIKEAVKLRDEINPNCNIDYKFAVGKENFKDMENAIELAIRLGCDSIQFKAYRNVASELDDFQKEILDKELQNLKKRYFEEEIIITGSLKSAKMIGRCFMTPIHILIDCYGDVYNCCYFRTRMSSLKIGNIVRDGFSKIWNSEKHWEVIKNIKREECELYDCKFFRYNKLMQDFMVDSRELDTI